MLMDWMSGKRDRGQGGTVRVLARAPEGRGCCVWRRGDFGGAVGEWGAIRTLVGDISRVQIPVTHLRSFELAIGSQRLEVG